ncbi:MAG: flagellar basal body-associated FliL family protein, partial [Pseudomonadota bacterium]
VSAEASPSNGAPGDGSRNSELADAESEAAVREDEVARALEAAEEAADEGDGGEAASRDFVRLEKQFVVPVLGEDRVASLVVLSIALEVDEGGSDAVFATEPKLRDAFLGVLFTHAQSRGFDGGFTRKDRLADLRRSLTIAAQDVLGGVAHGVLLTNIVRQDI